MHVCYLHVFLLHGLSVHRADTSSGDPWCCTFNEQTCRNSFRGVSILLIFKPQSSGFPRRDYGPSDMPVYIERYMKVEEDASRKKVSSYFLGFNLPT